MVQPRSRTQVLSGFALLFLLLLSHFLEERSTATPPQAKRTPDDYEQFLEGILDTPLGSAQAPQVTQDAHAAGNSLGFDVDQLTRVLRKVVPTANIRVLFRENKAILHGAVDRIEDIHLVIQAAQDVAGGVPIVNAIRVVKSPRVLLDVVLCEKRTGLINQIASQLLNCFQATDSKTRQPLGVSSRILNGPIDTHIARGLLAVQQKLGLVKVLAEPKMVALSGRQSSFLSGGAQTPPQPTGLGSVGVQFEEFGTRVECLPTIQGDEGSIRLEIELEHSSLDMAAGTTINGVMVPGRTTMRVRTMIDLKSGETGCLGGMVQHTQATANANVLLKGFPLVGPVLGKLCLYDETETIMLVTPTLCSADQ